MIAKAKLGDISYIEMGQSPQSSTVNDRENGIPFLQGSAEFGDVFPMHKFYCTAPQKLCRTGDTLMSVRAPVGELNKADQEYCIGRGLAAIRFTGVLPRFGWHMLNFWSTGLTRVAQGSTFEAINGSELANLEIVYFPENEQCSIADILDTIDAAIQDSEHVIAKQKAIRAGLLHDLLTYGLDAKGEPRDPLTHPEQFQELPLGLIPKEWEIVHMRDLGQIQLGLQRSPARQRGEYIKPYLRVANVFDGWIDYSDVLEMNFTPAEQQNYDLQPGDILLNEGQSLELVGRCAIYDGPANAFCFQNTLIRFRAYSRVLPEFCRIVFKQYLDNGDFMRVALQTTSVAHLGADRFANMTFLLPSVNEQQYIADRIHAENQIIESSAAVLNKLVAQKKGLMDDLLTGRVRVSNVQMDEVMEQK